jgi:hypothetical protein
VILPPDDGEPKAAAIMPHMKRINKPPRNNGSLVNLGTFAIE